MKPTTKIEPHRAGELRPGRPPGSAARGHPSAPAGARGRDEVFATLAHEFRNLLAPIRNGLRVLGRVADRGEGAAQAWGIVERQVGHLERLVDDLLDVSCLNAGKVSLRTERLDLASVVREAMDVSRPALDAARHQTVVSVAAWSLVVDGDRTRLVQAFTNLLNNAAKYTLDNGQVRIGIERVGCDAVVCIRDTGVGVPAEFLPRLFDMFVQVEHTPGRSRRGFGIGLPLVKRLVEAHGGSVEARSAGPGKGSEFIVRLPLAPEVSGGAGRKGGR
jgi:signal transduction histidine kinase